MRNQIELPYILHILPVKQPTDQKTCLFLYFLNVLAVTFVFSKYACLVTSLSLSEVDLAGPRHSGISSTRSKQDLKI